MLTSDVSHDKKLSSDVTPDRKLSPEFTPEMKSTVVSILRTYSHQRMTIVVTHGYPLTGTGSNLYVYNLIKGLLEEGHNVIILCQEQHPERIPFISHIYEFNEDNTSLSLITEVDTCFAGKCRFARPNIGNLLPVYVYDHYEGFDEVKTFLGLSDHELQVYIDANVKAIDSICNQFQVDCIQTNHAVMLPYVAYKTTREQTVPYICTIHGSALNFIVKKSKKYAEYCIKGIENSDSIIVDSVHAENELKEFLLEHNRCDLSSRVALIPAGVDVNNFFINVLHRNDCLSNFLAHTKPCIEKAIAARISGASTGGRTAGINLLLKHLVLDNVTCDDINVMVDEIKASYNYKIIDEDCPKKIEKLLKSDGPLIFFIGKYLWTKGLHSLILALPLIFKDKPDANVVLAGFGSFRESAELLILLIACGASPNKVEEIVENTKLFCGPHDEELPCFLDNYSVLYNDPSWKANASLLKIDENITFLGIVDHDQLKDLLPAGDVLVAPSVYPEAFGMVAIEAMSCGVFPVVTYQSAFAEIHDLLRPLSEEFGLNLIECRLDTNLSRNIAKNVINVINWKDVREVDEIVLVKEKLREIVVDFFSWRGIAKMYEQQFLADTIGRSPNNCDNPIELSPDYGNVEVSAKLVNGEPSTLDDIEQQL